MVTQKEVAERAGVSFITVSRVINKQGNVREATRLRVLEAISALNYHPNHLGQALNSGRNNTVAVITPIRFTGGLQANLYLIGILDGIERACRERRLDLLLSTESIRDPDFDYLRPWHQRKVDGVIFFGLQKMADAQIREIETQRIPCVAIADRPPGGAISWVDSDNEEAGWRSTRRLLELGHRRIAFMGIQPSEFINQNLDDRHRGYCRALREAGIKPRPEWVIEGDFSADSGRRGFNCLLERKGERPTALFCGNDDMALGAMHEALRQGFRVPEDFAFIGFDCSPAGQFARPSLASNQQALSEMGYAALVELTRLIADPQAARDSLVMPIRLVEGGSLVANQP